MKPKLTMGTVRPVFPKARVITFDSARGACGRAHKDGPSLVSSPAEAINCPDLTRKSLRLCLLFICSPWGSLSIPSHSKGGNGGTDRPFVLNSCLIVPIDRGFHCLVRRGLIEFSGIEPCEIRTLRRTLESPKFESALAALAGSVARWTEKGDRRETLIPGLSLFRRERPTQPVSGMYVPGICLAVRGAKRVLLGKESYVYGARRFLITSVDIPSFAQIIRASSPTALPGPKAQIRSPRDLAADDGQGSPPAPRTTAKPRLGDRRNDNAAARGFSAIDRLACGTSGYPDPRADHSTRDLLSSTGGRSRRASETDGDRRKSEPSDRSSDRLAEEQLRPAVSRR